MNREEVHLDDGNDRGTEEAEGKEYKPKLYPNFVYAGFGLRFWAFLIDIIVISSIRSIILNPLSYWTGMKTTGFLSPYNFLSVGIYLGYFTLVTYLTDGRTLGKMIFGLRVVSPEEDRLTLQTTIVREFFGRYILMKLKVFYVLMVFLPKKQHLADMLTETYVIKEEVLFDYMDGMKKALSYEN